MIENKYAYLGLGLAFLGGAALGAGAGYRIAVRRLNFKYEELLIEENLKTRAFFEQRYKVGDYSTPLDAADVLIPPQEAGEALKKYAGGADVTVKAEDLENPGDLYSQIREGLALDERDGPIANADEPPANYHNVFAEQSDDARLNPDTRDTTRPYVITEDEWSEGQDHYDTINLTYFAGDNVLSDDEDKPIDKVGEIIGTDNLGMFGVGVEDKNVVFVRNEIMATDFEITRREDEYKVTVLGFRSDNNLQHSDEPMPRRRRLQD